MSPKELRERKEKLNDWEKSIRESLNQQLATITSGDAWTMIEFLLEKKRQLYCNMREDTDKSYSVDTYSKMEEKFCNIYVALLQLEGLQHLKEEKQ